MIWKKCILLAREQTGEDKLGNPLYIYNAIKKVDARYTPWTDEQIALEGREVTRNEQQYLVPVPHKEFPVCQRVEVDGRTLEITQSIDLSPRWTMIRLKRYKG